MITSLDHPTGLRAQTLAQTGARIVGARAAAQAQGLGDRRERGAEERRVALGEHGHARCGGPEWLQRLDARASQASRGVFLGEIDLFEGRDVVGCDRSLLLAEQRLELV